LALERVEIEDGTVDPPVLEAEIIARTTTTDGFRFTTFQRDGTVYCSAERDEQEAVVHFTPGRGQSRSAIPQEILELTAQSMLEAMDNLRRGDKT
jgi:hypothetical protein